VRVQNVAQLSALTNSGPRTVIIGSGAIGLYTATELVKRGRRVIVIESGDNSLGGFASDSYASIGVKHVGIGTARSRTLGGTTNLWGGQLVEFQPVDFVGREWIPGSAWPVQYNEIAPFYSETYQNLGIDRAMQDDSAVLKAIGTKKPEFSEGIELFLTRWLKVPNFASFYAKAISDEPNLVVLTDHTAVGFTGSDGRIAAVKVVQNGGLIQTIAGNDFLVAAGTVESVRLLLHSANDPTWVCPWRRNQNLGAYFQDHIGCRVAVVHPENSKSFFNTFGTAVLSGHKFAPKLRLMNEVLETERLLNYQGCFIFESSVSENLVYLKQFVKAAIYSRKITGVPEFFRNLMACGKYLVPLMWKYVVDHRVFVPKAATISLGVQGEQMPCRESCITIDDNLLDRNGLPRVVLDWKISGRELAAIREFTIRVDRALRGAGLARLQILDDLAELNPRFISNFSDQYHQSGGALMGTSEKEGVVDRNLKVFGTDNLYVGGSSTFRSVSNANTTFMALTFATRLVQHLTGGGAEKLISQ